MKYIAKWISVGILISIGFTATNIFIEYAGNQFSETDIYVEANIKEIESLLITNSRVTENDAWYSVIFKIENTNSKSLYGVHVKAILSDKDGDLDICQNSYVTLKSKEIINDTLLCRVSSKKYPAVVLKSIYIESAKIES